MTAEWQDAWLWPEGGQARWWTPEDTQVWPGQEPALLLERLCRPGMTSPAATPVWLHLTEDWPAEAQRAVHRAITANPAMMAGWQVILDAPRTATPPVLPPRANLVIADLWPETERDDGQSPQLFRHLLDELPDTKLWRGIAAVERQMAHCDRSQQSLLVIIAHGSERHDAPPFRLADGRPWALPSGIGLPPLVILLACGNADHNLVAYGRRLRKAGVQTVLAPTGQLDARPADRFLRDFLHGWQAGQRVDELLWRTQRQPDREYGAGALVILGRSDVHVGPAYSPAGWPDAELERVARALTPDCVPALQALLERLTRQCYRQDGDLEGAVDALYEALDLDYDDRDREPLLLELLARHGSQWARLTQSWVLPYRIYLAEIYDHSLLPTGSSRNPANADAPHACYHRAKGQYRNGAYPRAVRELTTGLQALPPARWHQRSGLGLLGLLVNCLIDLNAPEPAQSVFDQLNLALNRTSAGSAHRQLLNHWDRRARLALRHGQPEIALRHYQQKRQRDSRDPDRELAWLLYVAAWADLPEAPGYAAEVQATLQKLSVPDFVFGRGNETPAYLLRALAVWAWRSADPKSAAGVMAWTDRLMERLGQVQDPGPFAMTLGYLHLYARRQPAVGNLPDWTIIADALEREHYWFELASLSSLLQRPVAETRRVLDQFQALRANTGAELATLPDELDQRVTLNWPGMLEQREANERALLLAEQPPSAAHWVNQGMLPL